MKKLPALLRLIPFTAAITLKLVYASCLLLLLFPLSTALSQTTPDNSLVSQRISYTTKKASEAFFLWTVGDWQLPDSSFRPAGTYIQKNVAYTPMQLEGDDFYVDLKLPKGTVIDFMIWFTKDEKGNPLDGWDTNWGKDYVLTVDGTNPRVTITDSKLSIVETKKTPFSILENGWMILVTGLSLLAIPLLICIALQGRSSLSNLSFRGFVPGLIFSTCLLMMLIRLQMNEYLSANQHLVFGVSYYDVWFIIILSVIVFLIAFSFRKQKGMRVLAGSIAIVLVLISALASLLNIEVVRQLGKPLNYNWLYYADFLQGNDAKNALKTGLTPGLLKNLALIMCGVFAAALGFSFLINRFAKRPRSKIAFAVLTPLVLLTAGYSQLKAIRPERGKIANPIAVLVLSWINQSAQPGLFTMDVSDKAREKVVQMHTRSSLYAPVQGADSINNVVLFVFKSTPAKLTSLYDSTYDVTPNLNKWKAPARTYSNVYAHLPSTPNAMFSIISGMYPMIGFKSVVKEHPDIRSTSLPGVLKKNGWHTSLFFSSDLKYSNLGLYLKNQQVEHAKDLSDIQCALQKFNSFYAELDGLDDRCIVSEYLDWYDSMSVARKFSILWTNQTHYPYFVSGKEQKYVDNLELNTYLNALRESDAAFGMLMEALQARGALEHTLVIVVGDHGEAFGTHNQRMHGSAIYEENVHIPCLLINPILINGSSNDNRVAGLVDVAPTVTHVLNIPTPAVWQGQSLVARPNRDHTFFITAYSEFLLGSRFGDWKFIHNATTGKNELYDLAKDPKELHNVADQYKELVKLEYELMAGWTQYHNRKMKPFLK